MQSSKNQQTPRREVAESHRNSRYLVYVKERGPGEHWVFRSLNVGRVPHKVPVCRGGLTRKRYPTVSRRNCAETPPNARGLLLSGNPTQQSIITGATDNSGAVLRIQALRAEIREDLRCDRRTRAPPCGGDWRSIVGSPRPKSDRNSPVETAWVHPVRSTPSGLSPIAAIRLRHARLAASESFKPPESSSRVPSALHHDAPCCRRRNGSRPYADYLKEGGPGGHRFFRRVTSAVYPPEAPVCRGGPKRKRKPTASRRDL